MTSTPTTVNKMPVNELLPPYNRFVMDMSITLGVVMDFVGTPIGTMIPVNKRGQFSSEYVRAQTQDVLDWMLAVSPEWKINTFSDVSAEITVGEDYSIDQYRSAHSESVFLPVLRKELESNTGTLMLSVRSHDDQNYLYVDLFDGSRKTMCTFTATHPLQAIQDYFREDDRYISNGDHLLSMVVNPFQVAATTYHNNRHMGYPRCINNIVVNVAALVLGKGGVKTSLPLMTALTNIQTIAMNNLQVYGFNVNTQLLIMQSINEAVTTEVLNAILKKKFNLRNKFTLNVSFKFMDDDRDLHSFLSFSQVTVEITQETEQASRVFVTQV